MNREIFHKIVLRILNSRSSVRGTGNLHLFQPYLSWENFRSLYIYENHAYSGKDLC